MAREDQNIPIPTAAASRRTNDNQRYGGHSEMKYYCMELTYMYPSVHLVDMVLLLLYSRY